MAMYPIICVVLDMQLLDWKHFKSKPGECNTKFTKKCITELWTP